MKSELMQDQNVRKAIEMGIDKDGFCSVIMEGRGVPAVGAFPSSFSYGNDAVKAPSYDPEEAKKLLESERVLTVQEATDRVGISRSSFYKYKDDIFPFHDNSQGTTITLTFQMDDEPGILSDVLKIIAEYRANILTIHQSIPINGIASLTLSIQVLQTTGDISRMIEQLEGQPSVHHVKILAKE